MPSFGVTPSNLWKSFTVPETRVFQAADGEDLVILACTVFDWSTRVMDRWTDRQRELRWLRCAIAVAAFAHKNEISKVFSVLFSQYSLSKVQSSWIKWNIYICQKCSQLCEYEVCHIPTDKCLFSATKWCPYWH